MKKLFKIIALMLAAVLTFSLLPASALAAEYAGVTINGTTGAGTEEDPVLVDTYEELKAALEFQGNLCVRTVDDIDVVFSDAVLMKQIYGIVVPEGSKKVLDLQGDICVSDAGLEDGVMFGGFLLNQGDLEIGGNHSIKATCLHTCRVPDHSVNSVLINEGRLKIVGGIGISISPAEGVTEEFAAAAIENRHSGMTEIFGGTYRAVSGGDGESTALISRENAGIVRIHDGIFDAEGSQPAAVAIGKNCVAEIIDGKFTARNFRRPAQCNGLQMSDEARVTLMGGNFQNITAVKEKENAPDYDLNNILAEDCVYYDYLTGEPCKISAGERILRFVRVDAAEGTAKSIREVKLSGIVPPVREETPDHTLNFPAESAFRVTINVWLDEKNREVTDKFIGGTTYRREIWLESKAGYRFAESLTASVNGNPLDSSLWEIQRKGFTLIIRLRYPATGEEMAFEDVAEDAWYYKDVSYAFYHNIMLGHTVSQFGPEEPLTRAQMTQILFNMNGKPAVTSGGTFSDVKESDWFFAPVTWAAGNKFVGGYGDGLFGPEDHLTREQLATILFRYSHMNSPDLPLPGFKDMDQADDWAEDAICWAVMHGILGGKGEGILDPLGDATRAEVAKMIRCYIENVEKKSYLIHFDSRGGSQVEDLRVMNIAPVHLPEPPVKEGVTFVCWKNENDVTVDEGTILFAEGELYLHAVWN